MMKMMKTSIFFISYSIKTKLFWQPIMTFVFKKGFSQKNLSICLKDKLKIQEKYSLDDGLNETISWFKKKYYTK